MFCCGKQNETEGKTVAKYDGASKKKYVKRFKVEVSTTGKPYSFISEHQKSKLEILSLKDKNKVEFTKVTCYSSIVS